MPLGPNSTPSEVCAEQGEVHVEGPAGIAVALTPAAAAETSDRLHAASISAAEQTRAQAEDHVIDKLGDLA